MVSILFLTIILLLLVNLVLSSIVLTKSKSSSKPSRPPSRPPSSTPSRPPSNMSIILTENELKSKNIPPLIINAYSVTSNKMVKVISILLDQKDDINSKRLIDSLNKINSMIMSNAREIYSNRGVIYTMLMKISDDMDILLRKFGYMI